MEGYTVVFDNPDYTVYIRYEMLFKKWRVCFQSKMSSVWFAHTMYTLVDVKRTLNRVRRYKGQ